MIADRTGAGINSRIAICTGPMRLIKNGDIRIAFRYQSILSNIQFTIQSGRSGNVTFGAPGAGATLIVGIGENVTLGAVGAGGMGMVGMGG